ncbi:MAG TPA: nuclease-related domain-containing protein [Candidatus Limnocylindrales bacterium]
MGDWRVKYDGTCARCGTALTRGMVAVWDQHSRTMRCVSCPTSGGVDTSGGVVVDEGVAGSSARHEYERRHGKRDAAIKARWGDRLGRVVLAVSSEPQATRAWAIGAAGEEKLARSLATVPGVRVLSDRHVPGRPENIDHVVVAPAGVFVVDAKHYEGLIEIRNRGWFWRPDHRLYVGGHDRSALADGLTWQVEAVEQALSGAGVEAMPPVIPVLCFVDGEWPLIAAPHAFHGARLERPRSLVRSLATVQALNATAIDRLAALLATALPAR